MPSCGSLADLQNLHTSCIDLHYLGVPPLNWAHHAIQTLSAGKPATINPRGHSMKPRVCDGDTVVVSPVPTRPCPECQRPPTTEPCAACDGFGTVTAINVDDIVLVKVKGSVYLHLVKAIQDRRYQIGNNRGGINGWVGRGAIYGIATSVAGRPVR